MRSVSVNLPDAPYSIHLGTGLLHDLGETAQSLAPHEHALVVMDENVADPHGDVALQSLATAGYRPVVHELVAEERNKTLPSVQALYETMLATKLDRGTPVISLGGGLVGDIAGFAAATFLRGVPFIQVPTTLLAMVDASIGGKTGVNFPLPGQAIGAEKLGKNLVGAFWQPKAVLVDPLVLKTLAPRDFRCGLAECVKHSLIADASLFRYIADNWNVLDSDEDVLCELIDRAVRIKVAIVEKDEREAGLRVLLNLGHTFAHAIEPISELDLRHGEAVSIGICAAAACSVASDRMTEAHREQVLALLSSLGLPTALSTVVDIGELVTAMGYDKKVSHGQLRLVLPIGIGAAEIIDDPGEDVVTAAWESVMPGGDANS